MTSSEDPRRRLLEAAGQIFAEKGYEGATVRDIIDRAGVNISAVNYYFQGKERLYAEVVKQAACGSVEDTPMPTWAPGAPPALKLRDFIRTMVSRLLRKDKPAWHSRLIMRELGQPTPACAEWVRDYVRPNMAVLTGILAEVLPPGASPLQLHQTGFSVMAQCLFYLQCKPVVQLLLGDDFARLTPEAVADHVAEFCTAALGLRAPRPKAARRASRL
jgi:AcrR family transcriptional regulator